MLQRLFKDVTILVLMVVAVGAVIAGCFHDTIDGIHGVHLRVDETELRFKVPTEHAAATYNMLKGHLGILKLWKADDESKNKSQ